MACIVGAPRCGTTTIARWMRRRPEICFSKPKEPHFFTLLDLTDVPDEELKRVVENGYLARYFADCAADTQLLGEGSVSYLYAPERLLPMLKIWRGAKFIIALRDPFEMLPSVHQRLLYQCDETEQDFATAWRLQEARASGRDIPRTCIEPRQLQYLEVVRLGQHVERFFEVIGRERCYIALFDDLKADAAAAYVGLFDFLGLPDDGFRDLRKQRPSRGFRYAWLQRLLKRPSVVTGAALTSNAFRTRLAGGPPKPKPLPAQMLMEARARLLKWNERPATQASLPEELKPEIRALLSDDVDRLGELIGRDLSHWLGRA